MVLLSYRQENDAHRDRVRALAERLRSEGGPSLRVVLDQFAQAEEFQFGGPPEGWPQWSVRQATEAEKILVVGSAGWYRSYEGKELPGQGLGAAAEAGIIQQRIYNLGGRNPDIRIVLLATEDTEADVPLDLQRYHRFDGARDFAGLLAWLTGAAPASSPAPAPGSWPAAPPPLEWLLADSFHVRDAVGELLTVRTTHRILLLHGPSEVGKSHLTRNLLKIGLTSSWLACGRFDLKAGAGLESEFGRFATQLEVEPAVLATPGPVVSRLDLLLAALRRQARPTLLIFDTFEQGGEFARWVEEQALVAAMRAAWLRVVVAGQQVPAMANAPWAGVAAPPLALLKLAWEDWYSYGKQHRSDLTPEFVQQAYDFARGRHPVLEPLLNPGAPA
jgi:hypothetical protein